VEEAERMSGFMTALELAAAEGVEPISPESMIWMGLLALPSLIVFATPLLLIIGLAAVVFDSSERDARLINLNVDGGR